MDARTYPLPLVAIVHTRQRRDGVTVSKTFVVSADPNDETKPDAAELDQRVSEWQEQEP
jgi:hypothetical protein